ncbi:sulfatase-like hydrolase/transferase [Lactococcus lactis]|uniref:Sulfatase-like hydrolase/transferase n=1 Tax=Lactococcus lactis TaxID=1358 RepID=A0A9X4S802_9LACT|nr:sulfatase-like hydrolase/transferase [Lactococcus lactis]MDG4984966.1 sulfatase-like hydrolase/transferase [Lactococcus lactis]
MGGGTTNVEFGVLTGFSYSFFNKQVNAFDFLNQNPTITQSITQYKNQSIAIHTHFKMGYHRNKVLPNLGFSKFIGREDMLKQNNGGKSEVFYSEGYLSDYTLFNRIFSEVKASSEPNLLVHGLSIQNHYPFTTEFKGNLKNHDILISGTKLDSEQKQLALYARGIKETDQSLEEFLKSLDNLNKNVTESCMEITILH